MGLSFLVSGAGRQHHTNKMPQDEIKRHPREPQPNPKTRLFRVGFAVHFLILSRYDVPFRNVFSNSWLSWRTYWPFFGPWAALGQLSGGSWPVLGFLFWVPTTIILLLLLLLPPLLRLLLLLHPTTIISTTPPPHLLLFSLLLNYCYYYLPTTTSTLRAQLR